MPVQSQNEPGVESLQPKTYFQRFLEIRYTEDRLERSRYEEKYLEEQRRREKERYEIYRTARMTKLRAILRRLKRAQKEERNLVLEE